MVELTILVASSSLDGNVGGIVILLLVVVHDESRGGVKGKRWWMGKRKEVSNAKARWPLEGREVRSNASAQKDLSLPSVYSARILIMSRRVV